MSWWPAGRKNATPQAVGAQGAVLTCPACQWDKMIVQKPAGRFIVREGRVEFEADLALVSCGHCLASYTLRLDGASPPVFVRAGGSVGGQGLLKQPEPEAGVPDRAESPTGPLRGLPTDGVPGMDAADIVRALRQDPNMRLVS